MHREDVSFLRIIPEKLRNHHKALKILHFKAFLFAFHGCPKYSYHTHKNLSIPNVFLTNKNAPFRGLKDYAPLYIACFIRI